MKRLIVLLTIVVVSASPILAVGGTSSQSYKEATPFVEANVPDGKALVYIYIGAYLLDSWSQNAGLLVLAKDGPIDVLPPNSYCTYVTDPGTIKLWAVPWASKYSLGTKFDAVAGQIYYVKVDNGFVGFKLIPNETAKKEIATCKLIE
jgi:hypothetical protein